jgi:hypothetical protein
MTKTIFEKYSEINSYQHLKIIKNPYPNSSIFKNSKINTIIFHTMQMKQILKRTKAFEDAMNKSDDPKFAPFKIEKYPDLTKHTGKLIADIAFLENWLKNQGVQYQGIPYKASALFTSCEYASHIASCSPTQVLAHFFANTHAVMVAHKEAIEEIIPESKINKQGLSHYQFVGIKAREFETLLDQISFTAEEEMVFLMEVTISFEKLFALLQEQDDWCKENQLAFTTSDLPIRTWPAAQAPAKLSASASCLKWGAAAALGAAATVAAAAAYMSASI